MAEAQYHGRCGLCQQTIAPGDEITELDGEWVHEACDLETTEEGYE